MQYRATAAFVLLVDVHDHATEQTDPMFTARCRTHRDGGHLGSLRPVATVFTKIIEGALPGRFVYSDDQVVGFLSINPLGAGHTLVVPRKEIDHWVDADPALVAQVTDVSHRIARAIEQVWQPPRVGLIIAGFEVPHMHVHVFPAWDMGAFDFRNAEADPDPHELDANAERLRAALDGATRSDTPTTE
jgi:histidine triad (HIT) family protein